MFTVTDRQTVENYVLEMARADGRVTAAAVVGSLALGEGDRWSDLDLTFALSDEIPLFSVLEEWTGRLVRDFQAVHLFDLSSGPSIYRVFLLPGCLQFDLSFTPQSQFGARGPKFRLLFGSSVNVAYTGQPAARDLLGYAVHHALRARFCIERGRLWQAEYWISEMRHYGMSLACLKHGLNAYHARSSDDLPQEVRERYLPALVKAVRPDELLRSLDCTLRAVLSDAEDVQPLAEQVEPVLQELLQAWNI